MKAFLAIVAATPAGRVAKYQDFDTSEEAAAHVEFVKAAFPDAFSVANPGSGFGDWLIDMANGTVVLEAPPSVPSIPSREEALAGVLDSAANDTARWALMTAYLRGSQQS